MDNVLLAFMLTIIAGLFTGFGSIIAFFSKSTNKTFLSVSLGFSAGVMIYVSMIEIFTKAKDSLSIEVGDKNGYILTVIAFFAGMIFIALLDKFVPTGEDKEHEEITDESKLMRMGIFTAIAIAIHNFPEGLATFVSALNEPEVAIPIVVAIAMHNIPEGIAVSAPIYHATGSKKKAFIYSFLSGLAEPVGALIGWVILMPIMSDLVYGLIFAGVAGIMVFISINELLPFSRDYGKGSNTTIGVFTGMIIMAISLLMFA